MTLTVPKASSNAGRAAHVRVEASQVGSSVAQFGQKMEAVGAALEDEQLSREVARFQTDLTGDMNNLRLEVMQMGDPDQAEAAWRDRTTFMRNSYLNGTTTDGRPRVSKKNAERFDLAFDELYNRNSFSLGKQTLGARHAQREATYLQYASEATKQGASADPDMLAVLIGQSDEQIDQLVANNVIDAAEGARRKIGIRSDISNARAIESVAGDPFGFLVAADRGDFGGLEADTLARYRVQASANIARTDAADIRAATSAQKTADKVIDEQLSTYRDIAPAGARASLDWEFLNRADVKSRPEYPETMAAISLGNEQPDLAQLTPKQLDTLIATESGKKVAEKYQTERLKVLTDLREDAADDFGKDPIAAAQARKMDVPDLPDFDPENPIEFGRALNARADYGAEMHERGYTKTSRSMSNGEREAFEGHVKADRPPEDKLAAAKALVVGYGSQARSEAVGISGDPVFAWSVSLLGQGVPDKTARDILAGQTKLATKTVASPSRARAIEQFHDYTGDEFKDQPELTESVLGAALAIYAEENPVADTSEIDADLFGRAINRAMGGTIGRSGDISVGGLQEFSVNDGIFSDTTYKIPLPAGVAKQDVIDVMNAFSVDENAPGVEFSKRTQRRHLGHVMMPANDRLLAASISGVAPMLGDDGAASLDQMRLEPLWPDGQPADRYVLSTMRGGRQVYLKDTNGQIFQLSLKELVRSLDK